MGTTSTSSLFGRAWELIISSADGQQATLTTSDWDPAALRMTFEVVENFVSSPFWSAEISIYNLTNLDQTGNGSLTSVLGIIGTAQAGIPIWITLKAGYQKGTNLYSTIWSGPVLQIL